MSGYVMTEKWRQLWRRIYIIHQELYYKMNVSYQTIRYHYYSEMLNALGLENSRKNEETLFVKVELELEKGEWWTNPETWKFSIKQDMVPEWFHDNEEHYRNEFKKVMKEWWNEHVFVDKRIEILTDDNYRLKRCVVNKLSGDAHVNIDETIIKKMCDNSAVGLMDEYSIVQQMSDNARIGMMMNCCIVGRMEGLSFINTMLGSSMVQEMHDSLKIQAGV